MRDGTEDVAPKLADVRRYLKGMAEDIADVARELKVSSICIDVDVSAGTCEVDMYTRKMERVMGFSADLGVDYD